MDARTTPRSARVYLDPTVARCEPAHRHCATRHHCARYVAEIPQPGGVLADFSATDLQPMLLMCTQYIAAAKCVKPAPPASKPKPWPQADSEW